MNKLAIIPIFFLSMCGTAPITDPPAAQAYPSDDFCERSKWVDKCDPKPLIPKEQVKGEIDITNPYHLQSLQMMFIRNARRTQIEENMTLPTDAINNALDDFWEDQNGSNGSTEQEKLL